MALTFPAYAVAGIGVPGTLATIINPGDAAGATFTSSTALTNWLDLTGSAFVNPIWLAVDYDNGTGGTHFQEKMLCTVNTGTQTFTIVSRMGDYPVGTAPTPTIHNVGVSIVPIFTGTNMAELEAAVQVLKTILLNAGVATTPSAIAVSSAAASVGTAPLVAPMDHAHNIPASALLTWLKSTGLGNPFPTTQNANYVAVAGDLVLCTASLTVTLPTPTAGFYVAVYANYGATHAAPVAIGTPSGAIKGLGVAAAATQVILGAPNTQMVLMSDGTNWFVIESAQDSGWTGSGALSNAWADIGAPSGTVAFRLVGNRVYMRGRVNGGANNTTIYTLPAGYRPPNSLVLSSVGSGANTAAGVSIATTGVITLNFVAGNGIVGFDGLTFTID